MILIGAGIAGVQEASIEFLEREGIPFVVLGNPVTRPGVPFVAPDNRAGAIAVVEHLIELGHKRIAYISRSDVPENSAQRFEGYRQALAEAGLPFDEGLVTDVPYAPYAGMGAMRHLLELPQPPTAVFAYNDHVAIDGSQMAVQLGLRIPEDVAIAGFDNIPSALIARPALTTVDQPQMQMGMRALELLLALIDGSEPECLQVTFPTQLMIRGSTVLRSSS